MRVFVAGASGAIGTRLVPRLIERGHEVIGTSRSPGGAERIRALGAQPIVLDLLDRDAVTRPSSRRRPTRSSIRRPRWPMRSSPATSTAASRRPTGCGPRAPTRCWPPRVPPACAASSRRASPASGTRARVGRSRPRTIRSTPPRRRRRARRTPRCATSTRRSRTPAGSRCATAASTALPTTACSRPCASAGSRSSATAAASSSFIHLDDAAAATVLALEHDGPGSTTSSTTSPPRCASGCPCSPTRSAPSRPAASRAGSRA